MPKNVKFGTKATSSTISKKWRSGAVTFTRLPQAHSLDLRGPLHDRKGKGRIKGEKGKGK